MTKIRELVRTLRTEYRTESVIADLSRTGEFHRFGEESKKTLPRLGKIELFELGGVSKNIQFPSCANYRPEGLLYFTCGICLMLSTEQQRKIKNQLKILSRITREVQSMDFLKNNMITSKREIQLDTHRRRRFFYYCQMAQRRIV